MSKEKKNKIKSILGVIVSFAIWLVAGGVCGVMMGKYMYSVGASVDNTGEYIMYVAITLLALYASVFVHIILHEGGHLVFGLMTGYKFSSFRIGSFMWIKKGDKVESKRFSLKGTAGQCLMAPPDMNGENYPFVWYNLGGCISNVVFASLAYGIAVFCTDGMGMFSLVLKVFAAVGVVLALLNAVPLSAAGIDNDGSNTIAIGKSAKARRAFWAMMKINERTAAGVRIKDMPEEWFALPEVKDMDNVMVSSTAVFKCNKLMDEMRFEEADKLMDELTRNEDIKMNGLYRNLLKNDMIFCEIIGENRPERIEKLLDKEQKNFMKAMKKFPSVLRTGYAYLLRVKKDEEKAAKVLWLFDKMAKTYPNKTDIDSERELIECIKNV